MAESRDNPRWFKNHEGFRGLRVAVDLFGSIELIYYPWSFGVWGLDGFANPDRKQSKLIKNAHRRALYNEATADKRAMKV